MMPDGTEVTPPASSGRDVLVAEDEAINRMYIVALLERLGLNCVTARNGQEAVDAFRTRSFDALIVDLGLPVMDGLEAVRQIRGLEAASGSRVPIAVLTAHDTEFDRECAESAGADCFLIKPFSEVSFLEAIESLIGPA